MGAEFEDYYTGIMEELSKVIPSAKYIRHLMRKNYFKIKTAYYEDMDPMEMVKQIQFQVNESKQSKVLLESSKTDLPVREITRDILNVVNNEENGTYHLPEHFLEDDFLYSYKGIPEFNIELTVRDDLNIKPDYLIDGNITDDDTIQIIIVKNPKKFPQANYDLIADINDNVRHEMEHIMQYAGMRDESEVRPDDVVVPQDKEYYKQAHEVPAEIAGFRRIVKLRKQKPEEVIRDWFYRSSEIHGLSDADIEELVDYLTKAYKEKYG